MDSYGVRRKDTTKGPPLRVLSLDGGGVRGYSMLIIVQELMHRTFVEIEGRAPRRHEIPKPCDHFDLIVGTGTGGLIAIMLGRLRLDLETCKELYVRLTRMVFETDKTIAGIPYRSTLFKASRLEDAIKQAVREHTIYEREGRDMIEAEPPTSPGANSRYSSTSYPRRHSSNASTLSFSARSPTAQMASRPVFNSRFGNPDARLYDSRESRTKTLITAVYKGSPRGSPPAILRSYDSRREPPPEFDCKIWQAGRATCAIGLAFKPIQIGQSIFHDDGAGTFNPAPEALDEAVINEWPGREVGVFISVGTGRRPRGSDTNQQVWYEGFMGEFAEARRRLVTKIEGCEKIHEYMLRDHLMKRNVNTECYYRLNVEIGVGEFGMNEWNRLGDISTSTRRYMSREEEQRMIQSMSAKLAKIYKAKLRWDRAARGIPELVKTTSSNNFEQPLAVELPGDIPTTSPHSPNSTASFDSGRPDSVTIGAQAHPSSPGDSSDLPNPLFSQSRPSPPPKSAQRLSMVNADPDRLFGSALTPSQYRQVSGMDKIAITSPDEQPRSHQFHNQALPPPPTRIEPPPLPPKTPIPEVQRDRQLQSPTTRTPQSPGGALPYPLDDEEPPAVDMARKPIYRG